jgi:hypothetical protein
VATFSNACSITAGACTDNTNVLALNQQYTAATGSVLNVTNSGTGNGLQIQNASSVNVLSVSTATGAFTGRVVVGTNDGGAGSANPTLLVLDGLNTATEPSAEVDGAMFFNANTQSFRCGHSGKWTGCDGQVAVAAPGISSSCTNINTLCNFDSASYYVPVGDCQTGVTYDLTASGNYSNVHTFNMDWDLNSDGTGTTLLNTVTSDPTIATLNSKGWYAHITMSCQDTSGNALINGYVTMDNGGTVGGAGPTYNASTWAMSNASANKAIGGHTLYWGVHWNSANVGNGAYMDQFQIVRHGP